MSTDPVRELAHDHADLNRRVLELGAFLREARTEARTLIRSLGDLREHLFLHFAREEEGLFPFVADALPELADRVHEMAVAHDAICGALARMFHLAAAEVELSTITPLFDRFETSYANHARTESELLQHLDGRLDSDQRAVLASLVRGL